MKAILFAVALLASPAFASSQTLYVAPPPTGNDSGGTNNCAVATTPCATLQHAADACPGGCAVHVAGGIYNETPSVNYYKTVVFTGDCGNLTAVVLNGVFWGQDHSISGVQCMQVSGVKTRQFAIMDYYFVTFGSAPGGVHVSATEKSKINALTNEYVSGDAAYHYAATGQSQILVTGLTLTLLGSRSFSAFGYSAQQSLIDASGMSASGSNSGAKCIIGDSSIIANGSVFPGGGTC